MTLLRGDLLSLLIRREILAFDQSFRLERDLWALILIATRALLSKESRIVRLLIIDLLHHVLSFIVVAVQSDAALP